MTRRKKTHAELLREVAAGLVRADLVNYAKTCKEAADHMDELEVANEKLREQLATELVYGPTQDREGEHDAAL